MTRTLFYLKTQLIKAYEFIKELDQIPMRNFHGDFYEEKSKTPRASRQNKVKVEDLRPKPPQD
ncbi:hypothetical protein EZJ49_08130 [Bdellovibrio bacteriovorus]|uniref:hypothetical protein n=1 Tax=Bdellovibrio bacteriovorus TaxID=959 RepID=UPI0021D3E45B|nr:hypothetical protein [Bdellovibrio bacteriovorus]UXR66215.1 hypothetical protein EZJ49_08130 [Bdellovibrio bacteriovorus]